MTAYTNISYYLFLKQKLRKVLTQKGFLDVFQVSQKYTKSLL